MLGCPNVDGMIEGMTSYQITEWRAYFQIKNKLSKNENNFEALQKKYHNKATGKR